MKIHTNGHDVAPANLWYYVTVVLASGDVMQYYRSAALLSREECLFEARGAFGFADDIVGVNVITLEVN